MFEYLQVGDKVDRLLGGRIPMTLTVGAVDEEFIYCGLDYDPENPFPVPIEEAKEKGWKFDKIYGVETDEEMGWGMAYQVVLSYLVDPYGNSCVTAGFVAPAED